MSLKALIKDEMGGDLGWAMALRLENRLDSKAYLLRLSMDGLGTWEDIIARVLGGASNLSLCRHMQCSDTICKLSTNVYICLQMSTMICI